MDLRVGRQYQLVKKIGSGAFGEIYEGKTSTNNRRLTLAILFTNQCFLSRPLHGDVWLWGHFTLEFSETNLGFLF